MLYRALVYIKRNNKRSIVLFLVLLVISCGVSVGLCTCYSINTVAKEVQRILGTSFVVRLPSYVQNPDFSGTKDAELADGSIGKVYAGPVLNDDVVNEILKVNGITSFNADKWDNVHLDNGDLFPGLYASDIAERNPEDQYYDMDLMRMRTTDIYGNTDTSLAASFRTGSFSLVKGRHINAEDERACLISEELADLNNFHVGDTISLSVRKGHVGNFFGQMMDQLGEAIDVEIVGLFRVNGYQPTGTWVAESDNSYNRIFTDAKTVIALRSMGDTFIYQNYIPEFMYDNVTFFVEEPEKLNRLIDVVRNLDTIDSSFYEITADDTMYRSTVDPLKTVRNWIAGAGIAIVIGCVVIISLLLNIWLRNRKKEIAIYLSMGFSKRSILGQLILEAVIITMLACVCSFGAGHYISNGIGNKMIAAVADDSKPKEREITEEEIRQAAQTGTTNELFAYESSEYAGPDQIDFIFRFRDFILMMVIEIVIIVAAVCKSMSYIHELQPRQILSDTL